MEEILKTHAPWIVPIVLLLLQTGLKLLIAENFKGRKLWITILQSPVEIGFLALSFMATILVSDASRVYEAVIVCFFFVLIMLASITIWKASPTGVLKEHVIKSSFLGVINFAITLPMLVYSISMLSK
jgi:hypothetical protein